MPEITVSASYQPADSSRRVLETTVGGVLRAAAERAADVAALVDGTPDPRSRRRWSYADLLAAAEDVACAWLGRFAPGERVAVWAPNSPEWLLAEFGAALAGLTLVTVNPALRAREVAFVLGQSRAQGVVLAPTYRGTDLTEVLAQVRDGLPSLREVISLADWDSFVRSGSPTERLPEVRPDDVHKFSTPPAPPASPKGVMLTHYNIVNNGFNIGECMKFTEKDRLCIPVPFFHCFGCVLGSWPASPTAPPWSPVEIFDPLKVLQTDREGATAPRSTACPPCSSPSWSTPNSPSSTSPPCAPASWPAPPAPSRS